jgi:hypothetical protein
MALSDVMEAAGATLSSLRAQGAHLHDPVRFRYLEALAARMQAQPPLVQQRLMRTFDEAAADCRSRMAGMAGAACVENPPPKAKPHAGGATAPSHLARLNRHIADRTKAAADEAMDGDLGSPSDMKSVRRFAETWSRLASEQQLTQALARGPVHAGPLNSHNLMLRAMSLMQGLSPDYLRRYMAQADALMWLNHLNQQHAFKDGKTVARRGRTKKPA